jgi:hypothetical protein
VDLARNEKVPQAASLLPLDWLVTQAFDLAGVTSTAGAPSLRPRSGRLFAQFAKGWSTKLISLPDLNP